MDGSRQPLERCREQKAWDPRGRRGASVKGRPEEEIRRRECCGEPVPRGASLAEDSSCEHPGKRWSASKAQCKPHGGGDRGESEEVGSRSSTESRVERKLGRAERLLQDQRNGAE